MNRLSQNINTAKYHYVALNVNNASNNVSRIGKTLYNSQITLTPHQIQAALFGFKSPLRKGVILADEVGLGKTIEAGIIIAQTWFEKKGSTLIIAPASLMKQWQQELQDKFSLPSIILTRKVYNQYERAGFPNPIKGIKEPIIICSYQMCSSFKDEIRNSRFDLVIIDEAHKLRNVYNESNITSNNIKYAIEHFKKVLLTATPIQNNLLDLYGLSTILDESIFGDKEIFKYNYIKNFDLNQEDLEERLKPFLHRTLRKQVQQYIKFTNRIPKTFEFEMTDTEKQVYEMILGLLDMENEISYLLPKSHKHLIVLILCKLLGSSMYSISCTLAKMRDRLIALKNGEYSQADNINPFDDYLDEENEIEYEKVEKIDYKILDYEISYLNEIIEKATSSKNESKYYALLDSLEYSFNWLKSIGAEEKVIIFTESRKTQDYLLSSLQEDGYEDILIYNGQNNSKESRIILQQWLSRPENSGKASNGFAVNMKAAILDKFKESGKILIATEAGAEGLNLQFCSLVINYDLPWNPQRVEQRIGRCHRIGQKHDVVVINFINKSNIVEQRIYELLDSKFNLFKEILGSSDSILGSLEDGRDIEKSIIDIYENCRTIEEINTAFDKLQDKYKNDIDLSLKKTKEDILNYFEEDIQKYFSDLMDSASESISEVEFRLWKIVLSMYKGNIKLLPSKYSFEYENQQYTVSSNNSKYTKLTFDSPFCKKLFNQIDNSNVTNGHIIFDITNYQYNLTRAQKLKNKKGYMSLNKVSISSFEEESYYIFSGILSDGNRIESDLCELLFRLDTIEYENNAFDEKLIHELKNDVFTAVNVVITNSNERNSQYLKEEINKINSWADDKIQSIQFETEKLRSYRKELQQESDLAMNSIEKERIENEIKNVSKKIRKNWLKLADAEELVEDERNRLIQSIKKENMKKVDVNEVFTVSFEVV